MSPVFDIPVRPTDPQVDRFARQLQATMSLPGFLERSIVTSIPGQTLQGTTILAYAKTDTTTFQDWYAAGISNATVLTTVAVAVSTLVAIPFVATASAVTGLAFRVSTASGANGKGRVGIYDSLGSRTGLMYPGSLVKDGGEFSVSSTGVKSTTSLTVNLTEGALYFAAYICGTAAPTVVAIPPSGALASLGMSATLPTTAQIGYTVSSTYSSAVGLPSLFPSGATALLTSIPALFVQYAYTLPTTRYVPAWSPDNDAMILRRVKLLSKAGFTKSTQDTYATLKPAVRKGTGAVVLGTFDSRIDTIQAGVPFYLTGAADINKALATDDILEVQVTQFGRPMIDLSDLRVQWTYAYQGGA